MDVIRCPRCGESPAGELTVCPSCGYCWPEGEPTARPATGPSAARTIAPPSGTSSISGIAPTYPREFGRFRLLREIGRGGMGVVYEAEDTQLVRQVALKTLFAGEGTQADQDRFLREAQIAGTLDHPNVVPVYDYGTIEGVAYYTMPLVGGLSLEEILPFLHDRADGEPPDFLRVPADPVDRIRMVLKWFEGALAGLDHAHGLGILHRDMKPSNLMLDAATGQLRITDFGLARAHHLTGLTQQGTLLGTVGYMSPEQVRGDLDSVTACSDVYSMGVALYRSLADRLPYSAETTGGYLDRIVSSPVELGKDTDLQLPGDLLTILAKSMEKAPALRYSSASDFAEDLGRFRRYEPIAARPVGPAGRLARWARRRPAVAGLVSVLLVAMITLGLVLQAQQRGARILRQQDLEAHLVAANYATVLEDPETALAEFERALEIDPEHFHARMGRALLLMEVSAGSTGSESVDQALEDLDVAGSLRPELSSVHLLRGRLLGRRGDTARAKLEEQASKEIAPQIALDFRFLGEISHRMGDYEEAIPYYTAAVDRDPQMFWAILRRGHCYDQLGRLEEARVDYEVVTHLVPQHAVPHNNLANIFHKLGDGERALSEYHRALEIEPANAIIHFNLGEELLRVGRWDKAEPTLRRAVNLDPLLTHARNTLGYVLKELGRDEEALTEFREAVQIEENRKADRNIEQLAFAITNLCESYLSRQDTLQASAPCMRSVELLPEDPDVYYNLATYRMLIGEPQAALELLERDFELGDTDYEYLLEDPAFEPLHADPRFQALVERMRAAAGGS